MSTLSTTNLKNPSSGSNNVVLDSSGRLLVGTSTGSSSTRFMVEGNAIDGVECFADLQYGGTNPASGTGIGRVRFKDRTADTFYAEIGAFADAGTGAADKPGRLVFSTTADGASSPTERMRIGNNGTLSFFDSAGNGVTSRSSAGATTSENTFAGFHSATSTTNGTASFVVRNNGNVLNTNNSYGSLSDIKLKENIVDATSQWSDIKALQVRKYNFKEETGQQTHTQIGLVAQEAELVSPGLVIESPDRDAEGNDLGTVTKSVNYSVLYMKAVKALQEAMERIEQLETNNADLLARITALESA